MPGVLCQSSRSPQQAEHEPKTSASTSQPSRRLHSPTVAGAKIAGQHGAGDLIHKPVPNNRTSVALAKTEGRVAARPA
jgi:hypothetical protein